MKKQYLFILLTIITLFLVGCADSEQANANADGENNEDLTIGFAVWSLDIEFRTSLKEAMEEEAKKQGVELRVLDNKGSMDMAISQLQTLKSQNVDSIILLPGDSSALNATVNEIVDSGIPVIGVNAKLDAEKLSSYVGSPDVNAGELEAEQMVEALGGKGNVVIMTGEIGTSASLERLEGIMNVLEENEGINIIEEKTANWSRDEGLTLMENWIQIYGDEIDGVIAQNDEMALGASIALEAKGMKDVAIVGIDGIKNAIEAVEEESMYATVLQNGVKQGEEALKVAIEAAKGNEIESFYEIPFELITKDNVNDYLE